MTTLDAFSLLTAVVVNSTSATVARGQSVVASPGTTQTLPAATANAMVAITASSTVTGASPVTVAGSHIYGIGLNNASSITLSAAGACVILQSDGTNWYVLAAENAGSSVSGGASNIATSQSTSSTTYTTLSTPDQVNGIVLPTNGLIAVNYWATWQESVQGAARAAIFIGANQLQAVHSAGSPAPQAAAMNGTSTALNRVLSSCPFGLISHINNVAYTGDVTTGQALALGSAGGALSYDIGGGLFTQAGLDGGWCLIDNLAAGTYSISVQFKASSGSVTVSNRRLRVVSLSFS